MLNAAEARVTDPILTEAATGYVNADLVGDKLFPRVYVPVSGGKRIEFGKEAFKRYAAGRAPGAAIKRVTYGFVGRPYALVQEALEGLVPEELQRDAKVVPGIDLAKGAVDMVMSSLTLGLEVDQAALATTAGNYDNNHKLTLSGTSKWSDGSSKPTVAVRAGREAVRSSTGMYPNIMVIGPQVFDALAENPTITDRLKYTSSDAVTTQLLAKLFEVDEVVVGKAVQAADDDSMSDVWGNFAVLAYVPKVPPANANMARPSFGYTYTMLGNPLVKMPYYDPGHRSWLYPTFYERAPLLTGITSGFLFIAPN